MRLVYVHMRKNKNNLCGMILNFLDYIKASIVYLQYRKNSFNKFKTDIFSHVAGSYSTELCRYVMYL